MYPANDDPSSSSTANTHGSKRHGVPEIDSGHNVPPKIDDDTEDAALTIEHLTFGRSRVAGGHSIPYFGARHPSSIGRKEPNNDYHLARTAHSSPGGQQNPPPLHPHRAPSSASPSHGLPLPPTKSSSLLTEVKSEREREKERERGREGERGRHQPPHSINDQDLTRHEQNKQLGKRFKDTLSYEERMARMDALLDIMEPTDLIDMFWRRTDVGFRYLMKIFPDPEKGKFLVNAVSPFQRAPEQC